MAKVTHAQTLDCYDAALLVRLGATTQSDAQRKVAKNTGMNEGNAGIIIKVIRDLLDDKAYITPLSEAQTRLVLPWIARDFGADIGKSVAERVLKHVRDTAAARIKNGPQHAVREAAEEFLAKISQPTLDSLRAHEVADLTAALSRTPAERAARLAAADPMPRTTTVTTIVHLRNQDVVAEVLLRAGNTCEVCAKPAPFLRLSNGFPYLEVHHKHRLADGGLDEVANAIALCPNCHREAHHGTPRDKFRI